MTASVVIVTNPFEPVASRSVHTIAAGLTVGALLLDCSIAEESWADGPEIRIGTDMVPADVYSLRVIGEGDIVTVIRWPMGGGGGGGGGKNPLRIVLTIAVMVAAIYLGPMAAVAMGYTATGTAAAMATAGIAMVGSVLINTVIPAPKPSMPSLNWGGSGSTPAPSPTYSLQAQGNQGRLGQPIPVIYGRHLIFPDLAAEPYQDYVGGEQYLYQLHVIGQGEYAVEQIRIAAARGNFQIQVSEHHLEVATAYIVASADSGQRKSAAVDIFRSSLVEYQAELQEQHATMGIPGEQKILQAAAKKAEEDIARRLHRLHISSSTKSLVVTRLIGTP